VEDHIVSATGFASILFEQSGPVATLTLNRPEALNAYSVQMRDDLYEVLGNIRLDQEIRVLLVRGAGRAFCAGADLTEFGTAPSPFVARRVRFARDVWRALRTLPFPTVAVLHGHVIGSGAEMALHCTLRLAGRSTRIVMPETKLGLIPAAGATQSLPHLAGAQRTNELLQLGVVANAEAALAAGLVDRVIDDEKLDEAALEVAEQIASVPAVTLSRLLQLLHLQDELPLRDAIAVERGLNRRDRP
jgi:enoyl-CoA hydratase/carnithine racemase